MSNAPQAVVGSVASLMRYPVKSMMGEELNSCEVGIGGRLGDRAYALVDRSTGKVASAKNPAKWPQLFDFRAAFIELPRAAARRAPVRITLPDGSMVSSDQGELDEVLSRVFSRDVTLAATPPQVPTLEEYWPDIEGLTYRETVTEEAMPQGTFFDFAEVHLLTTATINQLRELYPQGRFEVRRFRPNIVVTPAAIEKGFVENEWVKRTLVIGEVVRLTVVGPCPRCVMTTLSQGDLPKDPGILRTAAQHNQASVGVYATVVQGGTIRRGDVVRLE